MAKGILALVGSNNRYSINKKLITYVARHFENVEVAIHSWDRFNIPIYSKDLQKEQGIPAQIQALKERIERYDALLISVNEYNLSISGFFKNVIDWLSRTDQQFLKGKKVLVMSTSEDENGAAQALAYMEKVLPTFGSESMESFSVPSFSRNFDDDKDQIKNELIFLGIMDVITNFEHQLLQ